MMDHHTLLAGLQMLVKHGAQATLYDVYGSCVYTSQSTNGTQTEILAFRHSTPAWNIICRRADPWSWNNSGEDRLQGPGAPSNWGPYSLLSDFMCALEPYESIFIKSQREFPRDENRTMELFAIMQRSSATAEGAYRLMLDSRASAYWCALAMLTTSFYSAFGCGLLSLAALEGNLERMKFLLTNYRDTINELNLLKQTPLHLAVGHPSCVALLLRESGSKLINLPDSGGRRPLEYALFCCLFATRAGENQYHDGCLRSHGDTSLNILLDADCMITKTESWPLDSYGFEPSLCDNCLHEVSEHLVSRRDRLKSLAANRLPRMQANALGVFSPSVLDSNVIRVIQALIQWGISVPPSLQVNGSDQEGRNDMTSAYHRFYGPIPFSALWRLGLRDLDTPDMDGLTPLMSWCKKYGWNMTDTDAGRCSWLIEGGADLWKLAPDGVSTIGHELYSKIGQMLLPRADNEEPPRTHVFNLTRKLSHRDPRDGCHCACSPGGCTPFVRFLQAVFRKRYLDSASKLIENLLASMRETHTSLNKIQMRSVVRYATFEMMGIRHTCCHDDTGPTLGRNRQNMELDELRQEDSFLINLLDDLATEFEVKLEEMVQEQYVNKRVSFWHGCWLPRIQQVLESIHSANIEEPDKVAAEEIGVVWHKQESGKGKGCDEDFDLDFDFDLDSDSYSDSVNGGYHQSDWDSEIDEEYMIGTFRTMEDWNSRLDLIMSKAGLPAGR